MTTCNLTAKVKAGGCASKLSPKILDRVLSAIPRQANENVLVGFDTADDAGIYRLTPDLALVQTVDFFTPMVDDPFSFGAIAAANALSDVYAMGGKPLTALTILAWPAAEDADILEQIMKGGASKLQEAGCVILGGHSVNDPEIKFGYAITGTVHPGKFKPNAGAKAGDVLLLTKKLGVGVITTALKRGLASAAHIAAATASMMMLNRAAAEAMAEFDVHGVTDVTGFGLLGHAREMAMASKVTLEIDAAGLQFLDGAMQYAKAGALPGGLANNRDFVASCVEGSSEFDDLLYDPQTSGGLLISLPEPDAIQLLKKLPQAFRIGSVRERGNKPLLVR